MDIWRGKTPATIGQAIAAVKWQLKHQSQETTNFPITHATLTGIRRAGKDTRDVLDRYRERADITDGAMFQHIRRGDHIQPNRITAHFARRIIQKRADDAA